MPLCMLLCGPKIRNKDLVFLYSCILVVPIRILIGTTVVRIRILIGTTVVRIRILIGTTVVRIASVFIASCDSVRLLEKGQFFLFAKGNDQVLCAFLSQKCPFIGSCSSIARNFPKVIIIVGTLPVLMLVLSVT